MKLKDCINLVDESKPNAFSNDAKTGWLNEVEGMVQTEIRHVQPDSEDFVAYHYLEDMTKPLLVEPPHDKLYPLYLTAMIDFANGEYAKYQNSMVMFNAAWDEYAKWYMRNRHTCTQGTYPSQGGGAGGNIGGAGSPGTPGKDGKNGLSAYEIAVKHGFTGTEAQWLASLKGETGPMGPQGPAGLAGPAGQDGEKGDPGDPGVVAVTQAQYDALVSAGTVDAATFYFIVLEGSK